MTYKETLDYLYNLLPMYQRQGSSAFKKDLTNIILLLDFLDNPHLRLKSIHVAGTNGKGTVSHLIAGCIQSQGLKVGVYTSPHYIDFRERIKINGDYISTTYIKKFVQRLSPIMEKIKPSFFEVTVAMAFSYFKDEKIDWAVIETGLGGRLDSTNVLIPEISVITNIGMDHTAMLGNTFDKIAFEKAGIIKQGVPVVIGEKQKDISWVFEKIATEKNALLYYATDQVYINGNSLIKKGGKKLVENINTDIKGPFINKNLISAIATLEVLEKKGFGISWDKIAEFLPELGVKTKYMGRWQWLSRIPPILVDSAHNKEGLQPVLNEISNMGFKKVHFILGFSSDKDLDALLPLFPKQAIYYFAKANVPRGMERLVLKEKASQYGLYGKAYKSIRYAFAAARKKQKKNELIFIGGSIFTIAEVL